MDTLKEAETEIYMNMETATMGLLALSHWNRVVVLMQTDFREGRL